MIKFDKENSLFLLEGKAYTYAIHLDREGYLITAYYGPKLNDDNQYIVKNVLKVMDNYHGINYEGQYERACMEYTLFGRIDNHEPTFIARRSDGARMSRLRYVSHEIINGLIPIEGMPSARYGGETLRIKMKDDFSSLVLFFNYSVFPDADVVVKNIEYHNEGKESITLERAYSYTFGLEGNDYDVILLSGEWGRERHMERRTLHHGITKITSNIGKTQVMNPYMAICSKDATERNGDVYAMSLIYSGNYTMIAEVDNRQNVRLAGGISELSFSWELNGGVSLITPQVALTYGNGLGETSRNLHDFYRNHIIDRKWKDVPRPIVVNHWEATEMNFTEKDLYPIIDIASSLGIDTFVLDDGWFAVRNDDRHSLGDWYTNEDKLKGGLTAISERSKAHGLKFGLWFEPEMVNEDSELFRTHPEYTLMKQGVEPTRGRNQLVLDFSKKEVVDYIYNTMKKILDNTDISYIKWDMNRNIGEWYSDALPPARQGEIAHRYILGVYDLANRITRDYPHIYIEGCSSGGGRFDGGMLYYTPQIWTSDCTDAFERSKIQYGTSLFAPLSSISNHISKSPNVHTGREISIDTRYAVASMGSFGYELDITKFTDEEKEKVKEETSHYRSIEELIRNGDYYRLMNPMDGHYFASIVVSKDKSRAYLSITKTRLDYAEWNELIKLDGLDDNKRYYLKQLDIHASGKALKKIGIDVNYLREYQSVIVDIFEE